MITIDKLSEQHANYVWRVRPDLFSPDDLEYLNTKFPYFKLTLYGYEAGTRSEVDIDKDQRELKSSLVQWEERFNLSDNDEEDRVYLAMKYPELFGDVK